MSKPQRVSSRLIKKERQKLTKQIIWFSVLAFLLVLFFLFVVLPIFVRIMNGIINTNPISDDDGTVFIQAPVISAPPDFTDSASLTVSGFAASNSEVIFVVNGREAQNVSANEDGSFEASLSLTEGENSIAAYSKIEDNESPVSRQLVVVLDTEIPDIEVTSPEEGQSFNLKDESIAVSGKTDPEAKVYLNGRLIFPNAEGEFSTRYQLQSGEQTITIQAIDQAGNQIEVTRTIRAE